MVLVLIPWVGWTRALPFLTVLAPSERYHQRCRRAHKKLTDWARQMLGQVRRGISANLRKMGIPTLAFYVGADARLMPGRYGATKPARIVT